MAALNTGQWVKFFQQAGIPDKAAATYALTFAENRIQMNMLLDLNKEYLRDMGITLMGDVIAILRHARQKHDEIAREKLLVSSDRERPTVSSKAVEVVPTKVTKPAVQAKKLSVSQTSDTYTRDLPSVASVAKPKPKVLTKEPDVCMDSINSRKVSITQKVIAAPAKSKVKPLSRDSETITIEDDLPPKKARRVSPEEEGGYNIKMPSGSTPRSQQILAKSKELARRKNVFQRLGSGAPSKSSNGTQSPPSAPAVSSTTGTSAPKPLPAIGLSGISNKVVKSGEPTLVPARSQSSSVFQRLGDKQVSSSTTTQSVIKREEGLPYAGILKSPEKFTKRIVTQKPSETVTMVADSVDSIRTEVRERLGSVLRTTSHSDFTTSQSERKRSVVDSCKLPPSKPRIAENKLASDRIERVSTVKDRLKVPSLKSNIRSSPYSKAPVTSEKIKPSSRGVFSRLGM